MDSGDAPLHQPIDSASLVMDAPDLLSAAHWGGSRPLIPRILPPPTAARAMFPLRDAAQCLGCFVTAVECQCRSRIRISQTSPETTPILRRRKPWPQG